MEPKVIVGRNIKACRKEADLTQEALALRCDMHLVEIGRAERGVRDLRVSTVARIAKGLEIEASELLRGV
jgi:transcriptional regulator with XRE-family HTH domain